MQINRDIININKVAPYLPVVVAALLLCAVSIYADHLYQRYLVRELRHDVSNQLGQIRSQIEQNIHSNAQLVEGLVAAIAVEPNMSQQRFNALASRLIHVRSLIRNIAAAPDLVVRYVYPLAGNENVLGFNYRNSPNQIGTVLKAIDSHQLVIAGPVDLIQGGMGLITRFPLYIDEDDKKQARLWGIISAVIDMDRFYLDSGLMDQHTNIQIAIRGKDGLGEKGEVFYGNNEVFDHDPVLQNIILPYGSWQIAATMNNGWPLPFNKQLWFRAGLLIIFLLILTPVFMLNRSLLKQKQSENLMRGLFELSPIGIALNDYKTGAFIELNNALLKPTGYNRDEFTRLSYWDITPREYESHEAEQLKSLEKTGHYGPYEKEYIRKDGNRYPVLLNGMIVKDVSGRELIWSIVEDISNRKAAENALRESEQKFQRLVSDIGDNFLIYSHDPYSGVVSFVSGGITKIFGLQKQDVIDQPWQDSVNWQEDSKQLAHDMIQQIINKENEYPNIVMKFTHPDGSLHTISLTSHGSYNADGKLIAIEGIIEDISERMLAEQSIIAAKEEAEQANRAKTLFLSNISHELRTPLNAIIGFSQLLEFEELNEQQLDNVKEIHTAGDHLLELINEILDMTSIESGKIVMTPVLLGVNDIINDCISMMNVQAGNHHIHLSKQTGENHQLFVDAKRIKQSLLNLISNGIKYNKPEGSVTVITETTENNTVRIMVKDTGAGIAADKMPELFRPFSRLDADENYIEGTGIGLVITRNLVELMGGSVDVSSEPGSGSTFWIELPIYKSAN